MTSPDNNNVRKHQEENSADLITSRIPRIKKIVDIEDSHMLEQSTVSKNQSISKEISRIPRVKKIVDVEDSHMLEQNPRSKDQSIFPKESSKETSRIPRIKKAIHLTDNVRSEEQAITDNHKSTNQKSHQKDAYPKKYKLRSDSKHTKVSLSNIKVEKQVRLGESNSLAADNSQENTETPSNQTAALNTNIYQLQKSNNNIK